MNNELARAVPIYSLERRFRALPKMSAAICQGSGPLQCPGGYWEDRVEGNKVH
jgi:hypothetical protein